MRGAMLRIGRSRNEQADHGQVVDFPKGKGALHQSSQARGRHADSSYKRSSGTVFHRARSKGGTEMTRFSLACRTLLAWVEMYGYAIDVYFARRCEDLPGIQYWQGKQTEAADRMAALSWQWRYNA
jgi:hypothetical protein